MEILGGPLFAVAGAGESHGPGVTTIVFGCPAGLRIRREEIQQYLDRRRPGSNRHGTPRQEADRVVLLSGLYEEGEVDSLLSGPAVSIGGGAESATESYEVGYSTGEPIAALVLSTSQRSRHYDQFAGTQGRSAAGTHRPCKVSQVEGLRGHPRRRPFQLPVHNLRCNRRGHRPYLSDMNSSERSSCLRFHRLDRFELI